MSAKKKKKSFDPFKIIIIIALIGVGIYQNKEQLSGYVAQKNRASLEQVLTHEEGPGIPRMQASAGGQIIERTGYTLSYNADYKTPQWVAWELTQQETQGKEGRTDKFVPDPEVRGAKAYTKDYTKSGYDRGHMAPAADMKWSKKAMEESFYLSNICPQNPNLNRGDWNDLEEKSRQWAKRYGKIDIVCGPIYDTRQPKRIGKHKVGVPDAFYKVILIKEQSKLKAIGFIFPNRAGHQKLLRYVVSVDSVEKRTGIDFFAALPDEIEERIEAEVAGKLP